MGCKLLNALLLSAAALLAGCGDDPATSQDLKNAPPERVFKGSLAGGPVHLVVHNCAVYRVERHWGGRLTGEQVLAPEFYPFFTVCERQSLHVDGSTVSVTLGRTAIGAGGCCATGGTWRTTNGRDWTKL